MAVEQSVRQVVDEIKLSGLIQPKLLTNLEEESGNLQELSLEFQRELCLDSGYFDLDYYFTTYSDIIESNINSPIEHYLKIGYKEGRNPNPAFETKYYISKYKHEIRDLNPLVHYILKGRSQGYSTHSIHPFACKYYEILKLYFNSDNYFSLEESKLTSIYPLDHYLQIGYTEDRFVSPLFQKTFYEERYSKQIAGSCSFLHFIDIGESLGYRPSPLFDFDYYLKQCEEASSPRFHERPVADFLLRDSTEFVSPCILFDGEFYLRTNLDVAESKMNPFLHYIKYGYSETPAREPHPLFSVNLYRNQAQLDIHSEPIEHYLSFSKNNDSTVSGFVLDQRSWYRDKMLIEEEIESENPLLHYLKSDSDDKGSYLDEAFYLKRTILQMVSDYEKSRIDPKTIVFEFHEKPLVSVIIPNYNQAEATIKCLKSIQEAKTDCDFEVILVDDASTDASRSYFELLTGVKLLSNNTNQGYVGSCNKGVNSAKGDFIVQLNNDTLVLDGWLDALLKGFDSFSNVGLVGASLIFPNGVLQEAGGVIWQDGGGLNYGRGVEPSHCSTAYIRQVDYCSGACIMMRKSLWDELEGYDTYFSPGYYEDTDLAFRIRDKGYKVLFQPLARVIHIEGLSSGEDESRGMKRYQAINKKKFYKRWEPVLQEHIHENYRDRYSSANVLFIDAYTPTPDRDSGSLDIINYMQFFLDCEYKVAFLPMMSMIPEGRYTRSLQEMGVEWIGAPAYNDPYEYMAREGDFYDLVILYRAHATYVLIDAVRECCPNAKVIYETVDLHYLRHLREAELFQDDAKFSQAAIVKRQEMSNILKTDATILLSYYEYERIKHTVSSGILNVIPIARACIGTKSTFNERKDILFLGGFSHTPNIDCVRYLAQEIMPLLAQSAPHIKLRIAGADITQEILNLACENIIIEGYVEDLKTLFDSVKILVAPLRIGAGMKGKVVSALTHGLPCVISEIAAEGMNVSENQGIVIAQGIEETVAKVIEVYENEALWSEMSMNALDLSRREFSLSNTYKKLYSLLEKLSLPIPNNIPVVKNELEG